MQRTLTRLFCGLALTLLVGTTLWAQGMFATLTGVVSDPTGALVANAKATLRDAESGSERVTTTDTHGYYTFASVPVGTYILTIEAPGFQTYKVEASGWAAGKSATSMSLCRLGKPARRLRSPARPKSLLRSIPAKNRAR